MYGKLALQYIEIYEKMLNGSWLFTILKISFSLIENKQISLSVCIT